MNVYWVFIQRAWSIDQSREYDCVLDFFKLTIHLFLSARICPQFKCFNRYRPIGRIFYRLPPWATRTPSPPATPVGGCGHF